MKLESSRHSFEKCPNIKFHENPYSGSRAVPSGQTDGRADMRKLIDAFRNFANARVKDKSSVETQLTSSFRRIWLHVLDLINPASGHYKIQIAGFL
jgi:hypothetical protein